jgi:hypothetical protein
MTKDKKQILKGIYDNIIRPYHNNAEITKMRVEDAIELAFDKGINYGRRNERKEWNEVLDTKRGMVAELNKENFQQLKELVCIKVIGINLRKKIKILNIEQNITSLKTLGT